MNTSYFNNKKVDLKKSNILSPSQTYYSFTNLDRGIKYAKQENKKIPTFQLGFSL